MSDLVEAPPVEALPEGTLSIGPYTVLGALGPGRRTFAHLAKDSAGALVVLRELKSPIAPEAIEAELRSIPSLAVGEPGGALFAAGGKTYVPHAGAVGESLATVLASTIQGGRSLDLGVGLTIAMGIADRLAASGRPHGDLVPHHVIVGYDGAIHLRDPAAEFYRERLTAPDRLRYRSPEHVRVEPITASSDVFVLGILLFELTTQRRLYPLPDDRVDRAILEAESPKPRELVGDAYPIDLQLVLRKLLRPTSAGRFADGRAAKEALRLVAATRADVGSAPLATFMRSRFAERWRRWSQLLTAAGLGREDGGSERTHPLPTDRPFSRANTLPSGRPSSAGLEAGPLEAEAPARTDREVALRPAEPPDLDPDPTEVADGPPATSTFAPTDPPSADAFHFDSVFGDAPRPRAKKPQSKPMPPLDAPLPDLPQSLAPRPNVAPKEPPPLLGEERASSLVATQLDEVVESTLQGGALPLGQAPALVDLSGLPPLSEAVEQASERTPLDLDLEVTRQGGGPRLNLPPRDSTLVDPLPPRRATKDPDASLSQDLVLSESSPSDRALVAKVAAETQRSEVRAPRVPDADDTIDDDSVLNHLSRDELLLMAQATSLPIPPEPPKAPAPKPAPAKPAAPPPPTASALRPEPAPLFKEPPPLNAEGPGEQARLATQVVRDRIVPNRAEAPKSAPPPKNQRQLATQVVRDRIVPKDGPIPDLGEFGAGAEPTEVVKERRAAAARAPTAPLPRPSESDADDDLAIIPISDDELARASRKRMVALAIGGAAAVVLLAGVVLVYRGAETEVEALVVPEPPVARTIPSRSDPPPSRPPVVAEGPKVPVPVATGSAALGGSAAPPEADPQPAPAVVAAPPAPPASPGPNAPTAPPNPTPNPVEAPPPPSSVAGADGRDAPQPHDDVEVEADPVPSETPPASEPTPARAPPKVRARPAPKEKRTAPKPPPPQEAPPPAPAAPVTIRVLPETATVKVNGREVKNGSTLPVGEEPIAIEASAPGYEPARATVQPGWSKPVLLMLRKSKQP